MKNLFLHKSLQKDFLPKLLLLVVLFFGGCSTVNDTEEADAIDTAKGKTGSYFNPNGDSQTFKIGDDGETYTNYKTGDNPETEYILGYASSGTNYIEYVGTDNITGTGNYIKVVLSNITEYNGIRTEYDKDGTEGHKSGFTWNKSN